MNYNQMKKEELIKTLKERDAAIAGFKQTNATIVKEKDDLVVKIEGLTRDCEGMTEECNNLHNKINGLTDDLKKSNELCERLNKENAAIRVEKNALIVEKNATKTSVEQKEEIISTLKCHRVILGIVTIVAILIAIIF